MLSPKDQIIPQRPLPNWPKSKWLGGLVSAWKRFREKGEFLGRIIMNSKERISSHFTPFCLDFTSRFLFHFYGLMVICWENGVSKRLSCYFEEVAVKEILRQGQNPVLYMVCKSQKSPVSVSQQ